MDLAPAGEYERAPEPGGPARGSSAIACL